MKTQSVHLEASSDAAPLALFQLLADGRTWPEWTDMDECVPQGLLPNEAEHVGTVRRSRRGRTVGWDEITDLVPARTFAYRHVKGLPVDRYEAVVQLIPQENGSTVITWDVTFVPRFFGTGRLLQRGIAAFLESCLTGLLHHTADRH